VGSVVGQLAKIKGCRAVGIAGGAEKCRFAVEELGFDACIDHRAPGLRKALAAAAPQGIDVYFENVGGKVLEAVLPLLNPRARVPLCGLISQYNSAWPPDGPDTGPKLMGTFLTKRIKLQGFIITLDYAARFPEFVAAMGPWIAEGRIKYREDRVDSLEAAPEALIGLLEGRNFGKVVVSVGPA
jgi:NADPH-dependent curcumin reductase CurA